MLNGLVHAWAQRFGMNPELYRRLGQPSGRQWAEFLRRRGTLRHIGEHCSINPDTVISIPELVWIGDNVRTAVCSLLNHGGEVNMINRACGLVLDKVGKIEIADHVFIGHHAIIMPDVAIGSRCLVAAGAVVTRSVPPGSVVGGVPATTICSFDDFVERLKARNGDYPWRELIERRAAEYDAKLEPILNRMRAEYFFGPRRPAPPREPALSPAVVGGRGP